MNYVTQHFIVWTTLNNTEICASLCYPNGWTVFHASGKRLARCGSSEVLLWSICHRKEELTAATASVSKVIFLALPSSQPISQSIHAAGAVLQAATLQQRFNNTFTTLYCKYQPEQTEGPHQATTAFVTHMTAVFVVPVCLCLFGPNNVTK